MTRTQKIQKRLSELLHPIFPYLERLARPFKFERRQPFLLGHLHPARSLDELRDHLRAREFEDAVLAWTDDGQVLSYRKCISFEFQYHVRVFEDGEIRGHFEYTPEAAPLRHLMEVGQEAREEEFHRFLEDHLIPASSAEGAHR